MITWRCSPFDQLTPRELHDVLQARTAVFVVEQGCAFQDIDGVDPECHHLMGTKAGVLAAYCRLVPPGAKFAEPSIGRVITTPAARGTGCGRELVREALRQAERLWPGRALRIAAQQHLERFYGEFGFVASSAPYMEDGIAHIEMLRAAPAVADGTARISGH